MRVSSSVGFGALLASICAAGAVWAAPDYNPVELETSWTETIDNMPVTTYFGVDITIPQTGPGTVTDLQPNNPDAQPTNGIDPDSTGYFYTDGNGNTQIGGGDIIIDTPNGEIILFDSDGQIKGNFSLVGGPPDVDIALPEPATWAMMMLGVGFTGLLLRRWRASFSARSPGPASI